MKIRQLDEAYIRSQSEEFFLTKTFIKIIESLG